MVGGRFAWVTASYHNLYRLARELGEDEKTSPFFNVFHPIPIVLAGLAPIDADELIQKPAESLGVWFAAEELVAIQRIAGPLPYFLQAAAEQWFNAKLGGLATDRAKTEIGRSFAMAMDPWFDWYWTHFSDDERGLLTRIVSGVPTDWAAYRGYGGDIVENMVAWGLIVAEDMSYRVIGTAFAGWIHRRTGAVSPTDAQTSSLSSSPVVADGDSQIPRKADLEGHIPNSYALIRKADSDRVNLETASASQPSSQLLTGESDVNYKRGLVALKVQLEQTNRYLEFTAFEARLHENLHDERLYGASEASRSARARIINGLNKLALQALGLSFNDLALGRVPAAGQVSARELSLVRRLPIAPSSAGIKPPVQSRPQDLPFNDLSWEQF